LDFDSAPSAPPASPMGDTSPICKKAKMKSSGEIRPIKSVGKTARRSFYGTRKVQVSEVRGGRFSQIIRRTVFQKRMDFLPQSRISQKITKVARNPAVCLVKELLTATGLKIGDEIVLYSGRKRCVDIEAAPSTRAE